jgi:hypothetical protein
MKAAGKVVLKTIIGIMAAILVVALSMVYAARNIACDAYAQWDAALSVISYMEKNNGSWPRDWESLHQGYLAAPELHMSWENIQKYVVIDFSVDPSELVNAEYVESGRPFHVIMPRDRNERWWREPNTLVLKYLKERAAAQAGMGASRQDNTSNDGMKTDKDRDKDRDNDAAPPVTDY